jgi:hypothetical protein
LLSGGCSDLSYANLYSFVAKASRDARAAMKVLRPERDKKLEAWRTAKAEHVAAGITDRHAPERARLAAEKYVATELIHLERYGSRPVEVAQPAPQPEEPTPTFDTVEKAIIDHVMAAAHRSSNGVSGHAAIGTA